MYRHARLPAICLLTIALVSAPLQAASPKPVEKQAKAVLWRNPGDIRALDLFYGPGGKKLEPKLPVTFKKEDMKGTSPKFEVVDAAGTKWKAKLGPEARPETVASRLLWAVGYGANVNYFFPVLKVEGLPSQLQRGQEFVTPGSEVKAVRLQIHPGDEKKEKEDWSWQKNPFTGTREFNGLRVMMALINNWDLTDNNNASYTDPSNSRVEVYEVTDVGASFGKTGKSYSEKMSKGNLKAYVHSKFISKVTKKYVDLNFPTHPPFIYTLFEPRTWWHQLHQRWIGKHIPRADAKWIGSLLAQLSPQQIRDAFRAGGYTPKEIEAYATAVESRIAQLNNL
jgi:hypothetical protein